MGVGGRPHPERRRRVRGAGWGGGGDGGVGDCSGADRGDYPLTFIAASPPAWDVAAPTATARESATTTSACGSSPSDPVVTAATDCALLMPLPNTTLQYSPSHSTHALSNHSRWGRSPPPARTTATCLEVPGACRRARTGAVRGDDDADGHAPADGATTWPTRAGGGRDAPGQDVSCFFHARGWDGGAAEKRAGRLRKAPARRPTVDAPQRRHRPSAAAEDTPPPPPPPP